MGTTTLLAIAFLLEEIKKSKTIPALRTCTSGIEKALRQIAAGSLDVTLLSPNYVNELFYAYGVSVAKEGYLHEEALRNALQYNHPEQIGIAKNFYSYLTGKKLDDAAIKVFIAHIPQNRSKGLGNAIAAQLGKNWDFADRIRCQGYYKLSRMLNEAYENKVDVAALIPYACEYIRGVHKKTNYVGLEKISAEEAWKKFLPTIIIILECELEFIKSNKYNVFGKLTRSLMKINSDKPITRDDLLRQRISARIVDKLTKRKLDVERVTLSAIKYFTYFNMMNDTFADKLAAAVSEIQTASLTKAPGELYATALAVIYRVR